jgi:hypothetical protein
MKTYNDFLAENNVEDLIHVQDLLNESYEMTEEDQERIDSIVEHILNESANGKGLDVILEEVIREGFLGSILGGLTGFALGSTIGKAVAKVLGVERGILYDLLTSIFVFRSL